VKLAFWRRSLTFGWMFLIAGGLAAFVVPRSVDRVLIWGLWILSLLLVPVSFAYLVAWLYRHGMRRS
jgi:hypothetical protein